ncbi:MAG: restriction endonuclease subunit S [Rhodocyclaceae bacterium]|nr:restriction endonuclease subunit S [Rhodocyclaceae bacterium]MBX3667065.1 restriction endonuclease subunit S [Rhodocyclaceae bacterium]
MNSDWQTSTLGDLGPIKTGKTPPSSLGDGFGGTVPFVTPGDMAGQKWITDTDRYLNENGLTAVRSSLMPARSVAVSCIGSDMGKAALLSRPSVTNQQINTVAVDESRFNAEFVYYDLSVRQQELKAAASGSATPILNKGHFSTFEISLPPRTTQDKIAEILGRLDDKIELNRRINQTLEAMAQAIFKSWFVDFDPVKAKIAALQEGRDPLRAAMSAISGKSDAELDALPPEQCEQLAATAALFPDEMEESELGEIPKGWAFKSIADIAELAIGKVYVSSLHEDIYISTENMLENRAGVTRAASLPSVANVPSFKAGQILISNIRPYFKKIWMARFDGGRSPDVLAFEAKDPQWTNFLYNLMYQDSFFEFMTRTAKGAKMPRGDKDAIMGWNFPCDGGLLMAVFSERVRPHYVHIESLTAQCNSLSELRDTLLPKLLSGELSVSDIAVA